MAKLYHLQKGLILVYTKYEFGYNNNNNKNNQNQNDNENQNNKEIILVDEIHTPDSSRYWLYHSYDDKFNKNLEPDNIDKEFLRLWFQNNVPNPNINLYDLNYILPKPPQSLLIELSRLFIIT